MNATQSCPKCGTPLPPDAPEGLCPNCLLKTDAGSESATDGPTASDQRGRPAPPAPAEMAQHFPQLEILGVIGQGGMGVVYKARQRKLDRFVALKILPAEAGRDAAFAERFTREAKTLAKLNHPGIVSIYDFGHAEPFYYLIMEFVDGVNLRQLIHSRQAKPREALRLVTQVCEALQFAHDQGVVHRDIKPGNILVDRTGRAKIADFGLAKLLEPGIADPALTRSHHVMGTPHYMAPEQMSHPQDVDHRADIYSLGVVFYELLTGDLPLGRFALPSQKVQIDVRLDEVVLRTLEQEPARRYQKAGDVKTAVESIAAAPNPNASQSPSATESVRAVSSQVERRIQNAAMGLLIAGILSVLGPPGIVAALLAFRPDEVLSRAGPLAGVLIPITLAYGFVIFSAVEMSRRQSRRLALAGSILLMVLVVGNLTGVLIDVGTSFKILTPNNLLTWVFGFRFLMPGDLIGLPAALWALTVLCDPKMRLAFRNAPGVAGFASGWSKGLAWLALPLLGLIVAIALILMPKQQLIIREAPANFGHLTHDARWCEYSVEASVNHRFNLWLEWRTNGQLAKLADFTLADSFTPARGKRFKGHAGLVIWSGLFLPGQSTNTIKWEWVLRGSDALSGSSRLAENPFSGMTVTDSSYGHTALFRAVAGEEITLVVVRGDRDRLEGQPWDPQMTGRADVEMRLKARMDRVPEAELREAPQSSSSVKPTDMR